LLLQIIEYKRLAFRLFFADCPEQSTFILAAFVDAGRLPVAGDGVI